MTQYKSCDIMSVSESGMAACSADGDDDHGSLIRDKMSVREESVRYMRNGVKGEAEVFISGVGNYTGECQKTFIVQ